MTRPKLWDLGEKGQEDFSEGKKGTITMLHVIPLSGQSNGQNSKKIIFQYCYSPQDTIISLPSCLISQIHWPSGFWARWELRYGDMSQRSAISLALSYQLLSVSPLGFQLTPQLPVSELSDQRHISIEQKYGFVNPGPFLPQSWEIEPFLKLLSFPPCMLPFSEFILLWPFSNIVAFL